MYLPYFIEFLSTKYWSKLFLFSNFDKTLSKTSFSSNFIIFTVWIYFLLFNNPEKKLPYFFFTLILVVKVFCEEFYSFILLSLKIFKFYLTRVLFSFSKYSSPSISSNPKFFAVSSSLLFFVLFYIFSFASLFYFLTSFYIFNSYKLLFY